MNYLIRKNKRFGTTRIRCQDDATANIFLAAPDMYKALKELSKLLMPRTPEDSRLILKAEKALAKAEGKSQLVLYIKQGGEK